MNASRVFRNMEIEDQEVLFFFSFLSFLLELIQKNVVLSLEKHFPGDLFSQREKEKADIHGHIIKSM